MLMLPTSARYLVIVCCHARTEQLAEALAVPRKQLVAWVAAYPVLLLLPQQRLAGRLQWLCSWLELGPAAVAAMAAVAVA